MFTTSSPVSFARGFAVLRRVGSWVVINPEQTYVATRIHGLGICKSTFCPAQRRELPASARRSSHGTSVMLAAVVAIGLLSACAAYRPLVDLGDVTERGQYERDIADCQNFAAPVSPGASVQATRRADRTTGPDAGASMPNPHFSQPGSVATSGVATARAAGACGDARELLVLD